MVLAVLDVPDHDTIDQALMGLPIFRSLGGGVKTEVLPIRPYASFREDLRRAVEASRVPVA